MLATLSPTEVAYVMLAVLQGAMALLWALGAWWVADDRRATWHWAGFSALSAAMFVALCAALRIAPGGPSPEPLRAIGNVCGVLALLVLQRGVWRFRGVPAPWHAQAAALAAVLVASWLGLDPAFGWLRVGVNSAVQAALCGAIAHQLIAHGRDVLGLQRPALLAAPVAVAALAHAGRGLRALLAPSSVASEMASDSALNVGMALAYMVLMLAFQATLIALVVSRLLAELRHRSRHDPLTGLLNRRAMDEALHAQLQRSLRNGEAFTLMMLDIDHFKAINDRHGHAVGDAALRHLARVLEEGTREVDRIARYGGEEFVVLLPDVSLVDAQPLAERLREQVASQAVLGSDVPLAFTVSIGVAEWRPGFDDLPGLLVRADAALYRAKQNGRDRVEVSREGAVRVPREPATA